MKIRDRTNTDYNYDDWKLKHLTTANDVVTEFRGFTRVVNAKEGDAVWAILKITTDLATAGTVGSIREWRFGRTDYVFAWDKHIGSWGDNTIADPAIASLGATAVGSDTVTFGAKITPSDLTEYFVEYKTGEGDWVVADTGKITSVLTVSKIVDVLEPATLYSWQVRAINDKEEVTVAGTDFTTSAA